MIKQLKLADSFKLYMKAVLLTSLYIFILSPLHKDLPIIDFKMIINPLYFLIQNSRLTLYFAGISMYIFFRFVLTFSEISLIYLFAFFFISAFVCLQNFTISLIFASVKVYEFLIKPVFMTSSSCGLIPFVFVNYRTLLFELRLNYITYILFVIFFKYSFSISMMNVFKFLIFYFAIFFYEQVFIFNFSVFSNSEKEKRKILKKENLEIRIVDEKNIQNILSGFGKELQNICCKDLTFYFFAFKNKGVAKLSFSEFLVQKIYKEVVIFYYQKRISEILKMIKLKHFFDDYQGEVCDVKNCVVSIERIIRRDIFKKDVLNYY